MKEGMRPTLDRMISLGKQDGQFLVAVILVLVFKGSLNCLTKG